MAEPISPRPNIHYIGVIEDVGSRVVFKKYPIDLPRALIDDLKPSEMMMNMATCFPCRKN